MRAFCHFLGQAKPRLTRHAVTHAAIHAAGILAGLWAVWSIVTATN